MVKTNYNKHQGDDNIKFRITATDEELFTGGECDWLGAGGKPPAIEHSSQGLSLLW